MQNNSHHSHKHSNNHLSRVDALERAIEIAGGQSALARKCGGKIKQQHVGNWLHRNKQVSAACVLKVEAATNGLVTRYELRPDIYSLPRENKNNKRILRDS